MKGGFPKKINNIPKATLKLNPDDINDLPSVKCKCGSENFLNGVKIKKLSAILSPNGQEGYIQVPVAICVVCYTDLPAQP